MLDVNFHVCPVYGNVILSTGKAEVTCCGKKVPSLRADDGQGMRIDMTEDEYLIDTGHPMTKDHYFSFFAAVSDHDVQFAKLFPGGRACARFRREGVEAIYMYCTVHGLYVRRMREAD